MVDLLILASLIVWLGVQLVLGVFGPIIYSSDLFLHSFAA